MLQFTRDCVVDSLETYSIIQHDDDVDDTQLHTFISLYTYMRMYIQLPLQESIGSVAGRSVQM